MSDETEKEGVVIDVTPEPEEPELDSAPPASAPPHKSGIGKQAPLIVAVIALVLVAAALIFAYRFTRQATQDLASLNARLSTSLEQQHSLESQLADAEKAVAEQAQRLQTQQQRVDAQDKVIDEARQEFSQQGKMLDQERERMQERGSKIGVLAAKMLQDDYKVILIERDRDVCERVAGELNKTLVLNIDGRDVESLEEEGLANMDAFIAVTGDSESNIMSSLVAKNHGVQKTIARVENIDYIHLSQNIGIDTLINKKIIAASNIFKYVRKGEVSAIANLHGVDAEIIEFIVKPDSKVTKLPINKLSFPKTANISGVIRGNIGFIPFGNFQLRAGDRAVVFSLTESINKIEKYFL